MREARTNHPRWRGAYALSRSLAARRVPEVNAKRAKRLKTLVRVASACPKQVLSRIGVLRQVTTTLRAFSLISLLVAACGVNASVPTRAPSGATWTRWPMGDPPLIAVTAPIAASNSGVEHTTPGGWLDIVARDALARETVGGRLEVFLAPTEEGEGYELRLGSQVVLKSSYELMNAGKRSGLQPWIAGSLGAVEPFDEVVLVGWAAVGNACSGYGMTLVGVSRDGDFSASDIPYCGGPEPLQLHDGVALLNSCALRQSKDLGRHLATSKPAVAPSAPAPTAAATLLRSAESSRSAPMSPPVTSTETHYSERLRGRKATTRCSTQKASSR